MKRVHLRSGQAGFTILELMMASMIFAVVLLVIAVGVISVTNTYYKGVTSSKTQAAARAIMNEISQAIEYGQAINHHLINGNVQGICIDNTLYAFYPGVEVVDKNPSGPHQGHQGLIATGGAACSTAMNPSTVALLSPLPGATTLPPGTRELLGQHMRISNLYIDPAKGAPNSWRIHVRIIYGDDSLLTQQPVTAANLATELCRNTSGQQFCAVSDLSTVVQQRLLP